jgi:hypothetical protein
MRIATPVLVGSLAALCVLPAPVLAKNSEIQKADEKKAASPCQAYQLGPDGSWKPIACGEVGAKASPPQKSTARGVDERTR